MITSISFFIIKFTSSMELVNLIMKNEMEVIIVQIVG